MVESLVDAKSERADISGANSEVTVAFRKPNYQDESQFNNCDGL